MPNEMQISPLDGQKGFFPEKIRKGVGEKQPANVKVKLHDRTNMKNKGMRFLVAFVVIYMCF